MEERKPPIRVLVVEQSFFTRLGTVEFLRRQPGVDVVGDAPDAERALALFERCRPDVVVLDLRLPRMSGLDLAAALHTRSPHTPVLVFASSAGDEDIFQAVSAGVRGYVTKQCSGDGLLAAIRALHAGDRYLPDELAERLSSRRGLPQLTPRELEVLGEVADGASNKEIAGTLGIAAGTVAVFVNSILNKLGACRRTEAVSIARRRGLLPPLAA